MTLFLLGAMMVGMAAAACPNACSGHGTCDSSGKCTCYLEGKALYTNADSDPTAGWQRGAGGEAETRTDSFRRAVITATAAAGVAIHTGALDSSTNAGFVIVDGGAGYMSGASGTCTYTDAIADQNAAGCPIVGIVGVTGGTGGAPVCTVTVSSGAITRVSCATDADDWNNCVSATVSVTAPSYDRTDRQIPQAQWTGADCSLMTCPRGMSWLFPSTQANANGLRNGHTDNKECSDGGVCDRGSGKCQCHPGFEGHACQRTTCPDSCSGHGVCQSNIKFAVQAGARFLNSWDSGKQFGCKCDSGYRGLACAEKECPSDADPLSFEGNDEGRDCSGRGLCDYGSGTCQCFPGFTGKDCAAVQALA